MGFIHVMINSRPKIGTNKCRHGHFLSFFAIFKQNEQVSARTKDMEPIFEVGVLTEKLPDREQLVRSPDDRELNR